MSTQLLPGRTKWEMTEDDEGHREYNVEYKILADVTDGPFNVRNTPGMPLPGSFWQQGADVDPFAFCKRRSKTAPMQKEDEATWLWKCGLVFSTKPDKRCQDFRFEDPLTEPPKITVSWTKYKEEATEDRFNIPLRNSAHERLKGPQIEFDNGLASVRITQNVLLPNLDLISTMVHTLNSVPVWGLPIRCVKLSGVSLTKQYYGNCFPYWSRELEFDINPDTFDRDIADEGHKVLYGRWERPGVYRILCINGDIPDHKNPAHFKEYVDTAGNRGNVVLNGKGLPAGVCVVWDECAGSGQIGGLSGKLLGCPDNTGTGQSNANELLSTLTTGGNSTNYYISLWDNNRGASLQDERAWVNVVRSITPSPWISLLIYPRGSLVTNRGKTWIAARGSRGTEPGGPTNSDMAGSYWVQYDSIRDRGVYDWCTNYMHGDYVLEASNTGLSTGTGTNNNQYANCDKTKPGMIHIEKYAETNFFLLGIPALL